MQNRIDSAVTTENRDKIFENVAEIKTLLIFLIELSSFTR